MRYAIAGAFCILLASAPAFADCNYNANNAIKNCQSAIKDWFSNTKNNQSQSSEDIQKRVDSARDTLNECINCATSQIDNATEVDPGNRTRGLVGETAVPLLNGADDDEEKQTED